MNETRILDFDFLRSQIVGADAAVATPFGERLSMPTIPLPAAA